MSQYRLMRHVVAVGALGAFASVGCFVVDDEPSDDDGSAGEAGDSGGGTSGSGGSATGGKGGSSTGGKGGSSTGGSATGGKGGSSTGGGPPMGGTGGTSPGGAVMKFCNFLGLVDPNDPNATIDVPLTLTFSGVDATAVTGTCTPVVPNACLAIPTGANPQVALTDPSDGTVVTSGTITMFTIAAGDEILAIADIDETAMAPSVFAGTFVEVFGEGVACADTDPITTPPAMAMSAPFSLDRNLRLDARTGSRWISRATRAKTLGQ